MKNLMINLYLLHRSLYKLQRVSFTANDCEKKDAQQRCDIFRRWWLKNEMAENLKNKGTLECEETLS